MLKRILICSALLGLPNVSYAKDLPMSGFYIGADLGYAKPKLSGFAETLPPIYAGQKRTDYTIDASGLTYSGSIGFGKHWDNGLFTGLELGFSKTKEIDVSLINTAIQHQVDINYSGRKEISALVGYDISDNGTLFARLGYGFSDIYISPHDIGDTGGAFHDLHGKVYGIGYAHQISEHMGVRVQVKRFRVSDKYNNDKNDGENYATKIKDTSITAGVTFNF